MSDHSINFADQLSPPSLGFGCGRIFGGCDAKQSSKLIEAALTLGIRHFDVAPSYGDGTAEAVLGNVLEGMNDVTIVTKYGLKAPQTSFINRNLKSIYRRGVRPILATQPVFKQYLIHAAKSFRNLPKTSVEQFKPRSFSVEEISNGIESSLARLRRSRIDVFMIHEPDQFVLNEQIRLVLDSHITSGLIGAYGLGYGRAIDIAPTFGSVLQCGFDHNLQPAIQRDSKLILHGVIGQFQPKAGISAASQRAQRLKLAFDTFGASVVLFSASSVAQIKEVVAIFRDSKE